MENSENTKLQSARKRVNCLKSFYNHLFAYLIINIALLLIRGRILQFFTSKTSDTDFLEWVDWNILIVPIFWGVGLLIHALYAFQFKFVKNWENRKIKELIEAEESDLSHKN